MSVVRYFAAILLWATAAASLPAAGNETVVTAVFSKVFNGYERTKLPDGTFKPETYALGAGGMKNPGMVDKTIDDVPFPRVAQIMAIPLAQRGYRPTQDAENTDLLITVYYGRTAGTRGSTTDTIAFNNLADAINGMAAGGLSPDGFSPDQLSELNNYLAAVGMEQDRRTYLNNLNAHVLGYSEELRRTDTIAAHFTSGGAYREELLADVEEDRYYVILVACDYRTAKKEKKLRPLWSTGFNIAARRQNFEKALPKMAAVASRYFGRPSDGLLREAVPAGEVEIKDLINLGEVPQEKK